MHTLYGIKNCDTVKKARHWLDENAISYRFHDYRVDGLTYEQLVDFETRLGWEAMLNRSSTSWRQLADAQKTNITRESALQLMLATPTNLTVSPVSRTVLIVAVESTSKITILELVVS
jgi:Spx/MgsR family transcriptional regulator